MQCKQTLAPVDVSTKGSLGITGLYVIIVHIVYIEHSFMLFVSGPLYHCYHMAILHFRMLVTKYPCTTYGESYMSNLGYS